MQCPAQAQVHGGTLATENLHALILFSELMSPKLALTLTLLIVSVIPRWCKLSCHAKIDSPQTYTYTSESVSN